MKKFLFAVLLLVVLTGLAFGQEVLWTRYYSEITEIECGQIIQKTILSCLMQGKESVYVKRTDIETKKPYLQLKKDNEGDYWFIVAGPIYTSVYYVGEKGYRPTDNGYVTLDEYLLMIIDPKYAGIDISGYFRK
jgi:hypothetical protein